MKVKKSLIASIIITVTMLLSILSFPLVMWFSPRENEEDKSIEYLKRGITIIYVYYNKNQNTDEIQNILSFVESLPEKYTTTLGEIQIVVEEINSDEEKIVMKSYNGERIIEKENLNKESIIKNLCEILVYSSLECINIT